MRTKRLVALWAALILASATGLRATTEITGAHNSQTTGDEDGYDAFSGTYDVPADSGGVPSATFNDNGNDGLAVSGSGTSVTIEGGQFEGNFNFGVEIRTGGTVTISGGMFDTVATQDSSDLLTIYGGQFVQSENTIFDVEGEVAIYGGQFTSAYAFDTDYGTMDIYGAFAGVAQGQAVTLPQDGSGTFYGELEDNSSAQTYQYVVGSGTITLHGTGTLIPEPATLGLMGLAGFALLVRHRCTAIAAVRENGF